MYQLHSSILLCNGPNGYMRTIFTCGKICIFASFLVILFRLDKDPLQFK